MYYVKISDTSKDSIHLKDSAVHLNLYKISATIYSLPAEADSLLNVSVENCQTCTLEIIAPTLGLGHILMKNMSYSYFLLIPMTPLKTIRYSLAEILYIESFEVSRM